MQLSFIIAQAAPGNNFFLFYIIAIVVVFYFFMIRPQMKKAKDQQKMRDSLQKGDKIVTTGGIHGKIIKVEETAFLVEVDSNTKLKIDKSAVMNEAVGKDQK